MTWRQLSDAHGMKASNSGKFMSHTNKEHSGRFPSCRNQEKLHSHSPLLCYIPRQSGCTLKIYQNLASMWWPSTTLPSDPDQNTRNHRSFLHTGLPYKLGWPHRPTIKAPNSAAVAISRTSRNRRSPCPLFPRLRRWNAPSWKGIRLSRKEATPGFHDVPCSMDRMAPPTTCHRYRSYIRLSRPTMNGIHPEEGFITSKPPALYRNIYYYSLPKVNFSGSVLIFPGVGLGLASGKHIK